MALTKLNNAAISSVTGAGLPNGSLLQIVTATGATGQSSGTEDAWIDVVTTQITPTLASSKIYAQLTCPGYGSGTNYLTARVRIHNDTATNTLATIKNMFFRDASGHPKSFGSHLQGLDTTHNSTSAQTYKAQAYIDSVSDQRLYWDADNGGQWILTLMEIKG